MQLRSALERIEPHLPFPTDNADEGVSVNLGNRPLSFNEAMADMFGCSMEEMRESRPFERLHPDDEPSMPANWTILSKGAAPRGSPRCAP